MGFLNQKTVVVVGLASNKSIAYGVAKAMHEQGAKLVITYQNERLKARVEKLTQAFQPIAYVQCDVSTDQEVDNMMQTLQKANITIDCLVHSIAFAPADQLTGHFVDNITRDGFLTAHEISSYSLTCMAKYARQYNLFAPKASIVTMTYLGSEKAVVNYNTMGLAKASLEANVRYMAHALGMDGIRVNAVSAGPIRTLAASGISGFKKMLDYAKTINPTGQNVTIDEVGNVCAFLGSDLASGITGEVIHVDHGYHMVGVTRPMTTEATTENA